ncbi:MAG: transporter substrate-binding domain-containing protein [Candidatus Omnitrophota bacterium]
MKRIFRDASLLLAGVMVLGFLISFDAMSREEESLVFAGSNDFAPYSYTSNGVPAGYAVDLIKILSAAMNRNISIKTLPLEECVSGLEKGTIDGLIGIPYTREYEAFANYSIPSAELDFTLFVETSNQTVTSIKSLEGTVVALRNKCPLYNQLEKNERIKVLKADSIGDALLKLKNREITAVITEKTAGLWYIQQNNISGIKIAGAPVNPSSGKYVLAVAKKHQGLLKEINYNLNVLHENGTLEKLKRKWFGLKLMEPFPWKMASLAIGSISGIMMLLLGALWAISLNATVKIKTRQIQAMSRQMVEKDKLAVLGKLAGQIAHELRNPLGVISNSVYLLRSEGFGDTELHEKRLALLEEKTKLISNILESILSYSRIKAEIASTISAKECLWQVLKDMEIPHGIKKQISFKEEQFLLVFMDFHQLYSVFRNLVLNAVQAMEKNGVITIDMFPSNDNSTVNARVTDTGGGIPEEAREKIFHPFYTSKITGTGLGLPISKAIIEANNGKLYLEKTSKQGSIFMLQLPSSRMLMRQE